MMFVFNVVCKILKYCGEMCLIPSELKFLKVFFSHHLSVSMIYTASRFFSQVLMTAAIMKAIFKFNFFLRLTPSLCSKLPSWARAVVPKIFYVTEKAWNYYPYTITGKHTDLGAKQTERALQDAKHEVSHNAFLLGFGGHKKSSVVWFLNCC